MSNGTPHRTDAERPATYEIRVRGHLDASWAGWFEGWALVRAADGTTRMTGDVVDQAALHGLLKRVRDLSIDLVSVTNLTPAGGAGGADVGNPDAPLEDDHA